MADEKVMQEVELRVTVLAPSELKPEYVAELIARLIGDSLKNGPPKTLPAVAVDAHYETVKLLGDVTVRAAERKHAQVSWTVDDVQTKAEEMGLDLSDEEAETFLHDNRGQIQDDMVNRGWDSIETLLGMGDYKESGEPADDDDDDDDEPVIPAEAHTEDRECAAEFDAVEWFEAATDDEIVALARESWCQCKEANDVAQHCADENVELIAMFAHLDRIKDLPSKKGKNGYECSVDEDAARAWLDEHRPHLILRIDNGDDNG